MKVGNLIKIKKIYQYQPEVYSHGIILEIRETKWDENYRIIKILCYDGKICEEPLDLIRDKKCIEILA